MVLYCIIYIIFTVLTFAISYVIKPCIYAVLSGLNFIDNEHLNKILSYYRRQISCLNQLKK
jgi:hypothetical protein